MPFENPNFPASSVPLFLFPITRLDCSQDQSCSRDQIPGYYYPFSKSHLIARQALCYAYVSQGETSIQIWREVAQNARDDAHVVKPGHKLLIMMNTC
jgi:hypothetical protein